MLDLIRTDLHGTGSPALLLGARETVTRGSLDREVSRITRAMSSRRKSLVWLPGDRDLPTLLGYLAALRAGHTAAFLPTAGTAASVAETVRRYRPEFVVADDATAPHLPAHGYRPEGDSGMRLFKDGRSTGGGAEIDEHTVLLLPTSGSTGSPKAVRISAEALTANTAAIVAALGIDRDDRGAGTLPIRYAYGLSVLNTHLYAGGAYLVTTDRPASLRLWDAMLRTGVTSFAGVPMTYRSLGPAHLRMLDRSRIVKMTQAGGPLTDEEVLHWAQQTGRRRGGFHVMYGQTEATARISCLPPGELPQAVGSVGRALPGGRIWVEPRDGHPDGEICYQGPGVMSGYVERREELSSGGQPLPFLRTGDLGAVRDGRLYVTGRVKRIAKVLGYRVNLDELDRIADVPARHVAFAAVDDRIVMVLEDRWHHDAEEARRAVVDLLGVPDSALLTRRVPRLPRTPNGKLDYRSLDAAARAAAGGRPDATGEDRT